MNNRAIALSWWRSLSKQSQEALVKQFIPRKSFIEVTTSSSTIEWLYKEAQELTEK